MHTDKNAGAAVVDMFKQKGYHAAKPASAANALSRARFEMETLGRTRLLLPVHP